jgi:hypothetical protein
VRDKRRASNLAVLVLGALPSCATLSTLAPPPSLFPDPSAVEPFDFERDSLGQPPDGFEPHGQWAVVDSPAAVSGNQVVVCGGQAASTLNLKSPEPARAGAAEVALRILVGPSGAGLACSGGENDDGIVLKAEPHASRVALYVRKSGALTVIDQTPVATPKGEWVQIGLRCEYAQAIGYVDGKPVLRSTSNVGAFNLALVSDAGVIAQFDDLRYWVRK